MWKRKGRAHVNNNVQGEERADEAYEPIRASALIGKKHQARARDKRS
jgi:hypothetical protein